MFKNIFRKLIQSKYYKTVSDLKHYNYYIAVMITGIIYILENKIQIPHYSLIFIVTIFLNSTWLFLVNSKKAIHSYLPVAFVMILVKYNIIIFGSKCDVLIQLFLLTSSVVGILVNYRFNVKYKASIAFICLSLILASLVLDNFLTNFNLFTFESSIYDMLMMGVIAADIALMVGMFTSINHFNALFDKKICGIGLNIISKYIKVKNGLIIEDYYFLEKDTYCKIYEVNKIYTVFVNCRTCISVSVFSIIANLLMLFLWDLNLISIMTFLSIIYCLICISGIKFSTSDQEDFEELLINFIKFVLSDSRNVEIIEWFKESIITQGCTENEKKKLASIVMEASHMDINQNVKENALKTKLVAELVNIITDKKVPKIIV